MVVGTAGFVAQRRRWPYAGLAHIMTAVMILCGSAGLSAAVTDAPLPAPVVPPLTPLCAVPENDIATPAPLPNVTALLKKHATIHILAIGSSSTWGVGASSLLNSYPMRLGAILDKTLKGADIEIANRGIAGELADTTADRIMSEVALSKPDLVLWQLGTNDALSRVPPKEFETTVRETVRWLKSQDIDVALVGLQYVPRYSLDPAYSAIRKSLRKVAKEENVLYVRRYDAMRFMESVRANEKIMAKDEFHLNDLGYRCMAEHIAHAVIISLFAKPTRPASE